MRSREAAGPGSSPSLPTARRGALSELARSAVEGAQQPFHKMRGAFASQCRAFVATSRVGAVERGVRCPLDHRLGAFGPVIHRRDSSRLGRDCPHHDIDREGLIGAFSGFKSGHALNNRLLRELLATEDAWEMVTFDNPGEAPISFMRPASAG